MVKYVVTDKALGYCKRWGSIDCSTDPGFDGYTEINNEVADLDLLQTEDRWTVKVVDGYLAYMDQSEIDAVEASRLPDYKLAKYQEFDVRTGEMIGNGFEFPPSSGHYYSLSAEGQSNLLGAYSAKDEAAFTYPVKWPTILDDYELSIPDAATLTAFYLTALGTVRVLRDSGTALKEAVRACTTKAEVDAIVDPR